jgi:hypothetical protein
MVMVCFAIYLAATFIIGEMRRQGEATRGKLETLNQRLMSMDERQHRAEMGRKAA